MAPALRSALAVTDLDQPGSGWSGTIGVVDALAGEPIPPPFTLAYGLP